MIDIFFICFMQIFKALSDILQFIQPILLRELMDGVTDYSSGDATISAYRGVFISGTRSKKETVIRGRG